MYKHFLFSLIYVNNFPTFVHQLNMEMVNVNKTKNFSPFNKFSMFMPEYKISLKSRKSLLIKQLN